jgi:hypothetical protein
VSFFAHVNNGAMLEQLLAHGFLDAGRNAGLDEDMPNRKKRTCTVTYLIH